MDSSLTSPLRMANFHTLINDLETAIQEGTQDKRVAILRQVTNLFVLGAHSFNADHVELFGDVLIRLVDRVETKVLAELSGKLAPIPNAPNAVIQNFARHDQITVAHPVLTQSAQLTDDDLIDIANSKGQSHLGAISERPRLAATVTDVLVERGDNSVALKLARNEGASFSDNGFNTLARRAEDNAHIAENLGRRADIPLHVLHRLMARATEEVHARILASAPEARRGDIQKAIEAAVAMAAHELAEPGDFKRAEKVIGGLKAQGQLNEEVVVGFAQSGEYEKMVVAIAHLGLAPVAMIDQIVQNPAYHGLLTACKACDFGWKTFVTVLTKRFPEQEVSSTTLEEAYADFHKMLPATAKRIYRFWLAKGTAKQFVH